MLIKKSIQGPPARQSGDGERSSMPLYSGNQSKNLKPLVAPNANAKGSRMVTK